MGRPNVWRRQIYPAIKKTLKLISKTAFDNIDLKPGRFELFGGDW